MTKCPYCDAEVEICHDDGVGLSEDEIHQQECYHCDKTFTYTTSIVMYYDTKKADCLNDGGGDHNWKRTHTFPKEYSKMFCTECGERRDLTDEERRALIEGKV